MKTQLMFEKGLCIATIIFLTGCGPSTTSQYKEPTISTYRSEWTATAHASMCMKGKFNGRYVLDPGFGVGGREIITFPDGSKMYTVYETYKDKIDYPPDYFTKMSTRTTITYLNRYDFYVDDNDNIIKCVPTTRQLSQKYEIL